MVIRSMVVGEATSYWENVAEEKRVYILCQMAWSAGHY